MEDYREVTSAIEGRLCLRSSKAPKHEILSEDYFQSRTDRPPTVNSWLSGRAMPDISLGKSNDRKEAPNKGRSNSIASDRHHERKRGITLPSLRATGPAVDYSTNDAASLTIELAEPNLYLEGFNYQHCTEHRSTVLRGVLRLQVKQKAAFHDLSLRFEGISETIWPESWRLRHVKKKCRESFVHHDWNFLDRDDETAENERLGQSFDLGTYDYPFELPLDSSLPETIDLPMGGVYYTLTATASPSVSSQTSAFARKVNLVRIPCSCSLELTEPCGATGFQHGLRYNFMLHGQSFPVGGQVPLGIRLVPTTDCSWQRLTITIEEDIRYRTRDGFAQREQSRVKATLLDKRAKQDDFAQRALRRISAAGESMSSTYAGSATIEKGRRSSHGSQDPVDAECLREKAVLQLPSCSRVHPDTAYSCLYVQHTLVITILARISMPDDSYKHFQIRVRLPIQLLTCKLSEGNTVLPEYAESADTSGLDEAPRLCRCVSSSNHSERLEEVNEDDVAAGCELEQAPATSTTLRPPSYHDD